jgi:RNA polymerase sigma factor (sigma-70 family)
MTSSMPSDDDGLRTGGGRRPGAETTIELLQRAQAHDRGALEELMARYHPRLRRWASGRLPRYARDLLDTVDIVQDVLLRTFVRLETLEAGRDGSLQAYLRQCVMNAIRDEIRRAGRRPGMEEVSPEHPADAASTIEVVIRRQELDRYERALATLEARDREALVARLELGCSYAEVAAAIGCPTDNAARKVVERAMVRLVDRMRQDHTESSGRRRDAC